MNTLAVVEQLTAAAPESLLLTYGPLGIILGWFMWRAESKMDKIPAELRTLGHRLDGLTRALLADVISRENTHNPKAREIAQNMLADMDAVRKAEDVRK